MRKAIEALRVVLSHAKEHEPNWEAIEHCLDAIVNAEMRLVIDIKASCERADQEREISEQFARHNDTLRTQLCDMVERLKAADHTRDSFAKIANEANAREYLQIRRNRILQGQNKRLRSIIKQSRPSK